MMPIGIFALAPNQRFMLNAETRRALIGNWVVENEGFFHGTEQTLGLFPRLFLDYLKNEHRSLQAQLVEAELDWQIMAVQERMYREQRETDRTQVIART